MYHMKVFATEKEIEDIKERSKKAGRTPMLAGSFGPFMSSDPWQSVHRKIHKYALEHGLPETDGFYGMNLETGEFLSNYDVEQENDT